jgi:hypothetical protein
LSADGRRVYFLIGRSSSEPSELLCFDIATGRREAVLPGFAVRGYDISYDERQVVFTSMHDGASEVWIAPLDRHEPPRRLVRGGDEAAFDSQGRVYFRRLDDAANHLHRVNPDGTGDAQVLDGPILEFHAVAPGGDWVTVDRPIAGSLGGSYLMPLHGGTPRLIRNGWWPSRWSRDGRTLYLEVGDVDNALRHGRTALLPVSAESPFVNTIDAPTFSTSIPHAEESLSISSDPSRYVFVRTETRRNVYRIPLH